MGHILRGLFFLLFFHGYILILSWCVDLFFGAELYRRAWTRRRYRRVMEARNMTRHISKSSKPARQPPGRRYLPMWILMTRICRWISVIYQCKAWIWTSVRVLPIYCCLPKLTITKQAEESASYIPSESSIKVAKEKRGRLRQTQATGEEDFISLSVAKLEDGPKGPHPESRLMREEDELGEGEDGKPFILLRPLFRCIYFVHQNSRSIQVPKNELRWARNHGKRKPLSGEWRWKR